AVAILVKVRRVWLTSRSYHCSDHGANRFGDHLSVKAAVLDENLVGVHPRHQHARQVNTLAITFERFRVGIWPARFGIESDPVCLEKSDVGMVSGHGEDKIVAQRALAVGRLDAY